jgi:hypothetical protein
MWSALVAREGDQPEARRDAGDLLVGVSELAVQRAVDRMQHRCYAEPFECSCERARVIADDVELPRTLVARENVAELGKQLADSLAGCLLVYPRQPRVGAGVAGGEHREVVPRIAEAFGEKRNDTLDTPVEGRWHWEPDWAQ